MLNGQNYVPAVNSRRSSKNLNKMIAFKPMLNAEIQQNRTELLTVQQILGGAEALQDMKTLWFECVRKHAVDVSTQI